MGKPSTRTGSVDTKGGRSKFLRSCLDELSFGFAVFDDHLDLVWCNKPFRELRSYPAVLCTPGTHISEFFRFNAERGDYGPGDTGDQVQARVDAAANGGPRELEYELTTGRILNIRYHPHAKSGLVVSYVDVTDRRRAEIELEKRELRNALVEQAATEGIYEWLIDKGEVYTSPRMEQIFGFDSGELNPRNWEWNKRIHPDDFERYKASLRDHFKEVNEYHECEYRIRDKGGSYRWIIDRGVCVRDGDGRAIRMIGAVGDITRHKEIEAALRESENRYSLALQAVNEGVYDWNIETGEVYYSDRVYAVLGLGPDQLTDARDWMDIIHPEDRQRWQQTTAAHFRGETDRFECDLRYRAPGGEWRWARQHGTAVRDENGRACRMVGSTGDITDLRRKELELADMNTILKNTLENVDQGISMVDGDLRVITFNQKFLELLELPPEVFRVGYYMSEAFRYNAERGEYGPGDIDQQVSERVELASRFEAHRFERTRPDGTVIEIHGVPLSDRGGLVTTYTDITNRKRRELEIAEKTETLEALSEKLSKYLSPQVYASIFSGEREATIAAQRKKLTVFFSDIAGFTEMTDSLESEELTTLLNQYLTEMSRIALDFGATIDKFVGDAVMVFFGDPETRGVREDAINCVNMAIAMQARMSELQNEWLDRGLERIFKLRIGINTGYCTVGNFGSDERMDYTIIGNEVNLAARLQTHADVGGILLSRETWSLVRDTVMTETGEELSIKGFANPIQTYSVVGSYSTMEAEDRIVRMSREGVTIVVDKARLTDEALRAAIEALEQAGTESVRTAHRDS